MNRHKSMEKTSADELRRSILPVLLYCQANKGDLKCKGWQSEGDAGRKFFYAYYSGLFCRILCMLEMTPVPENIVRDSKVLLDKYNWYDIQQKDLELCKEAGPYGCEVPDALKFIDGVDNVAWKDSGFGNGRDSVCLKMGHSSWTFADVRGSINPSLSKEE